MDHRVTNAIKVLDAQGFEPQKNSTYKNPETGTVATILDEYEVMDLWDRPIPENEQVRQIHYRRKI